jgi:hypothetical protein
MSKEETIKPQLFEIKHDFGNSYVVAYDMIHALQSMPGSSFDKSLEVKQLTGGNKNIISSLHIAKECLPQGLVNKTVDDNESKT